MSQSDVIFETDTTMEKFQLHVVISCVWICFHGIMKGMNMAGGIHGTELEFLRTFFNTMELFWWDLKQKSSWSLKQWNFIKNLVLQLYFWSKTYILVHLRGKTFFLKKNNFDSGVVYLLASVQGNSWFNLPRNWLRFVLKFACFLWQNESFFMFKGWKILKFLSIKNCLA